jgi:hypothetical protein
MRPGSDANRPWRADVVELLLERPAVVEHLNTPVSAIADIHISLRVGCDRVQRVELARSGTA